MRWIVGAFLISVPSAALAQSTTDCTRDYFGNVHCTTQPQPGLNWGLLRPAPAPDVGQNFVNGYQQGQQIRAQVEERRAAQQAAEAQEQSKEVADMLAAGDCSGAQQYALSVGNVALAQQAKDYCSK